MFDFLNTHDPALHDISSLPDIGTLLADTGAAVGLSAAVAGAAVFAAQRGGWAPARLRNYTAGSLILPATVTLGEWSLSAPITQFAHGVVMAGQGGWLGGVFQMSALVAPAALGAATWWWAARCNRMHTVGKKDIPATERAQRRDLDAQFAAARNLATTTTPLTVVRGRRKNRFIVLGRAANRVSQHRRSVVGELVATTDTLLTIPYGAVRKNVGVLGGPGSGKTTGLCRLSVASHVASHERYLAAARASKTARAALGIQPKPALGIFLTCKGGVEDLSTWADLKKALLAAGIHPSRIGMLPADKLDLFALPPDALRHVIEDLAPTANATDAAQKFYEELRISLVHLVVDAPDPAHGKESGENPPTSSDEFMDRFDKYWLWNAWGGQFTAEGMMVMPPRPKYQSELNAIQACNDGKQPVMPAEAARFSNLFRELDDVFDGTLDLLDKDYWFITVPGTAQKSVATSQANAVIKLVEQIAATDHGREITFTIDEFSRVSGGAALTGPCEALRSQGVACLVGAHSFESLAGTDRDAKQLMKAWSGGLLCFGLEGPDEIVTLYGTRRALEPSRHTLAGQHGNEGQVRMQDALLIDPNLLRRLQPGDCVYVNRGTATWGRVTELNPDTIQLRPTAPIPTNPADTRARWLRATAAFLQGKGTPA